MSMTLLYIMIINQNIRDLSAILKSLMTTVLLKVDYWCFQWCQKYNNVEFDLKYFRHIETPFL